MAPDHADRILTLLRQACTLQDPSDRRELAEQACELADFHDDLACGYQARVAVLEWGANARHARPALASCIWLLANATAIEQAQERISKLPQLGGYRYPDGLLRAGKWVVALCCWLPEVAHSQLDAAHERTLELFSRHGGSPRGLHDNRHGAAMAMGEPRAEVRRHWRLWEQSPTGRVDDCPTCQLSSATHNALFEGRLDEARQLAGRAMSSEKRCDGSQFAICGSMALALQDAGALEEADRSHRLGYALGSAQTHCIEHNAQHLRYATRRGDYQRARAIFEAELPRVLRLAGACPLSELRGFLAARLFLQEAAGRAADITIELPATFPLWSHDGRYDVDELLAWFDARARELALRFDERNGNDWCTATLLDSPPCWF